MDNRSKFYCWLIGKLQRRRMTLQEICSEWADSPSNYKGSEISVRSFHRYREEISSIFGLDIECDKSDGYRYFIRRDMYADTEITDWLLSSLRIASLGDMLKHHDKVVLEDAPQNTEYIDDILGAIDKHYAIKFHYRTAYGYEQDMEIVPAFIRLFHQRWYVIGNLTEQNGHAPKPLPQPSPLLQPLPRREGSRREGSKASPPVQGFNPRALPFDRISYIQIVCKRQVLSKKTRELMKPENFYYGCFGIIRQENLKPVPIRIRAFYPENNYIDEVPLHETQRVIREADDHSFTDYELYVRPTRDLEQELLWHGRKITVLAPDDFRKEMIGILKDMTESYETGKNTVEE